MKHLRGKIFLKTCQLLASTGMTIGKNNFNASIEKSYSFLSQWFSLKNLYKNFFLKIQKIWIILFKILWGLYTYVFSSHPCLPEKAGSNVILRKIVMLFYFLNTVINLPIAISIHISIFLSMFYDRFITADAVILLKNVCNIEYVETIFKNWHNEEKSWIVNSGQIFANYWRIKCKTKFNKCFLS